MFCEGVMKVRNCARCPRGYKYTSEMDSALMYTDNFSTRWIQMTKRTAVKMLGVF